MDSFAPLRFNRSSSVSLAFEPPRQSISTRTLTPARARSLRGVDELGLELARGPDERLEMHAVLGGGDVRQHRGEDRAVLQHGRAVAFVDGAFGEARDQRQRVLDLRVFVGVELEVRSAASAREQEDQRTDQRGDDRRNDDPCNCRHRLAVT